jgi:thimet oligopeptidase
VLNNEPRTVCRHPLQLLGALTLLAAISLPAAGAPAERPLMPIMSADQLNAGCAATLADLRRRVSALEQRAPAAADSAAVLGEWDAMQAAQSDFQSAMDLLGNVSPDKAVRDAAEPCRIEFAKFNADLFQDEKLYALIKAVTPADAVERKLRQDLLWAFEDTGVSLPPAKRARMKQILARLQELSQDFERDIRDNDRRLVFTPEDVKGLPADYLARAKRDDQGNYLLGFAYPEYYPFMENADSSAARRRYQFAFQNRGTAKNLDYMKEAIALRKEIATLFGLPSYAEYVIRRRMAGAEQAVNRFLGEVGVATKQAEIGEIAELRAFAAETTGKPLAETKLDRWDLAYWQRKLKLARYQVDPETMRKYFPTDAAVAWVMAISAEQYGIEFRPVDVPVWSPDVRYYDIVDAGTQARIAGVYLDLVPREGKYGHAAMFPVRYGGTATGRTPIAALVANLNRAGLDNDELETLTHEFGHVLHHTLSRTRFVSQSGTSVETDFVEAPSQMFEEWARRAEPLALLAKFCKPACPAVDAKLAERLTAAHNFGRAIRYSRQLLYADFDMAIHGENPKEPMAAWISLESATPLGYVKGTEFPGQFDHLMNGYEAGYYGYMWSEVLALDMLTAFGDHLMNPAVGRRYRETILSRGGEARGMDLVRAFLGREPNNKAFFDELAGKRLH